MIDQTVKDQRHAAKGFDDAESEYNDGVRNARAEAGGHSRRGPGHRARLVGGAEAASCRRGGSSRLVGRRSSCAAKAKPRRRRRELTLAPLSASLASRVLGFDVTQDPKLKAELDGLNRDSVVKN